MDVDRGIAARAGGWSARHRAIAIIAWVVFVVGATAVGGAVGTENLADSGSGVGESGAADETLDAEFKAESSESVLIQSSGRSAGSPAFRAKVEQVERALARTDGVGMVAGPFEADSAGAVSSDGHSALVGLELEVPPGGDETEVVAASLETVAALDRRSPAFRIEQFGDASADLALSESFEQDFRRAEITSLPVTLIVLIVVFGALVAALVPLVLAATAVMATIGLLAPLSQIWAVDDAIFSVVLLIGLAVGVDYSLFYLRRVREERSRGASPEAAIEVAAATSGRAVLVSGLTVAVAMAGMYLAGAATFTSFATGTILVVAVAVVGSLTVLPALVATLGDRINRGRIPFLRRPEIAGVRESRLWRAVLTPVLRRPKLWGGIAVAVLLLMATPVLHLRMAVPGTDSLPRDLSVVQTYDSIQEAFPGQQLPATVVIERGRASESDLRAASRRLRRLTSGDPLFPGEVETERSRSGDVLALSVPLLGDGADESSYAALERLREEIVPATFGRLGAEANVTGFAAGSSDFKELMEQRMPIVIAFVLALAFLLLLVTFRSIVIPIKAIALNLLSVGAAYGLVVWIFQDGHLESLLGFESNGAITAWLPMFMFVVLFGLSMDYHVFILSRVREAYDRGADSNAAVAEGIRSTAGVVTAAAAVMVAVFSIFATLSALEFKQMGIGLAAAVLIDATLIRGVLLPASMALLGDWNWYLPRSLAGLMPRRHHHRREPGPEPARA